MEWRQDLACRSLTRNKTAAADPGAAADLGGVDGGPRPRGWRQGVLGVAAGPRRSQAHTDLEGGGSQGQRRRISRAAAADLGAAAD